MRGLPIDVDRPRVKLDNTVAKNEITVSACDDEPLVMENPQSQHQR